MSQQPDEAVEVLRSIWSAQGQTSADLDEDCGPTKACKNMTDVSFDGLAEPGSDLRPAWRDKLRREGKLSTSGGSIRDLVLGFRRSAPRLDTGWTVRRPSASCTEILRGGGYLADRGLATALFVALSLRPPDPARGRGRRRQDRGRPSRSPRCSAAS